MICHYTPRDILKHVHIETSITWRHSKWTQDAETVEAQEARIVASYERALWLMQSGTTADAQVSDCLEVSRLSMHTNILQCMPWTCDCKYETTVAPHRDTPTS